MNVVKFDPRRYKERFLNWRFKGSPMPNISEDSRQLILNYIADMEIGININPSSRKGSRTYCSLQGIRTKMLLITELLEKELGIHSLVELESKELELLKFFKKMREGGFNKKYMQEPITGTGIYVTIIKAFWHWYQRVRRKNGVDVKDITVDLDATMIKPRFNYFTIKQLKMLGHESNYFYRILMWFMFDSGIRSPTELMNVRISDLEWNKEDKYYFLNIREETSKTFGRKIKLLLCSEILQNYIKYLNLKPETYLFRRDPHQLNQYLKNIGYKTLKIGTPTEKTYKGRKYTTVVDGLTMYDFRHSAACFWLQRYKSETALKYRFGWKKSEMIEYYTSYAGMQDTITKEDLIAEDGKFPLERELRIMDIEKIIMEERMEAAKRDMEQMNLRAKAIRETAEKTKLFNF